MTLSHDEANARLLDLVYGEAAPGERTALEAHVATCAQCTADLAALGGTRARVRAALDDQDVPRGAHARLLEAAEGELEAAARAQAARAEQASIAARARAPIEARGSSFWERLRGKWTFPTLATVGAVAVVIIGSKIFLEPQRTMERGRDLAGASPPPAAAPAAPIQEYPTAAAASSRPSPPRDEIRADQPKRHAVRPRPAAAAGPADAFDGARGADSRAIGGLQNLSARGKSASSVGHGAIGAAEGGPSGRPAEAKVAAKAEAPGAASGGGYASPPTGWKGGAARVSAPSAAPAPPPAPVAAAPARRAAKTSVADNVMAEEEAEQAPPASRGASLDRLAGRDDDKAAAQPLAKKKAEPLAGKRLEADAPSPPASPPAARELAREKAPAPTKTSEAAKDVVAERKQDKAVASDAAADPSSQEALARRADQLFAARRWSEAIAAYRELVRRFPDADLNPRWRARVAQAQAESAVTAQRAAKAAKAPATAAPAKASKKATAADPLEGL